MCEPTKMVAVTKSRSKRRL